MWQHYYCSSCKNKLLLKLLCGESNSRGVAILTNCVSNPVTSKILIDKDGRCVSAVFEVQGKTYILCNIYAPNHDDPDFFVKLIKQLDQYSECVHDGLIIGGDLNLVMNPKMDHNDSTANHCKALDVLNDYLDHQNLHEILRIQYPEQRRYSWHRSSRGHKPLCYRIDIFMTPVRMGVTECEIKTGHCMDHSLVELVIQTDEFRRGPGVWKLNNNVLMDDIYCARIKEVIKHVVKISAQLNPYETWEFMKIELGIVTRIYLVKKARSRRNKQQELLM